jgi:hypothetical protein
MIHEEQPNPIIRMFQYTLLILFLGGFGYGIYWSCLWAKDADEAALKIPTTVTVAYNDGTVEKNHYDSKVQAWNYDKGYITLKYIGGRTIKEYNANAVRSIAITP